MVEPAKAEAAFRTAAKRDGLEVVLTGARKYAESPEGKSEPRFLDKPATWLRAGRYLEDSAQWKTRRVDWSRAPPLPTPEQARTVDPVRDAEAVRAKHYHDFVEDNKRPPENDAELEEYINGG